MKLLTINERYRKAKIVGIALAQVTLRASKTKGRACVALQEGRKEEKKVV